MAVDKELEIYVKNREGEWQKYPLQLDDVTKLDNESYQNYVIKPSMLASLLSWTEVVEQNG